MHRFLDDHQEVLLHQLTVRHIDRDALETRRAKPPLPIGKRAAGLLQHPCAERLDQSQLLGNRDEGRRRDWLTIPLPTHQRFETDAHAGAE